MITNLPETSNSSMNGSRSLHRTSWLCSSCMRDGGCNLVSDQRDGADKQRSACEVKQSDDWETTAVGVTLWMQPDIQHATVTTEWFDIGSPRQSRHEQASNKAENSGTKEEQ